MDHPRENRNTRLPRLAHVDALRGLACFLVMLHHTYSDGVLGPKTLRTSYLLYTTARMGWLGVNLFFVISGFCLYFALARSGELSGKEFEVKDFFRRRFWRIVPPYWSMLAMLILVRVALQFNKGHFEFPNFAGPWDVPLHVLMLHNFSYRYIGGICGAFWSLAVEFQWYLIFPLLIFLRRNIGLFKLLLIAAGISIGCQLLAYQSLGFDPVWPIGAVAYDSLPGRIFEFVLGMAAAHYVINMQRISSAKILLVCIISAVVGVTYILWLGRFGPFLNPIWGVCFAALLVLGCPAQSKATQINPISRVFVWLGKISYSLYLVHKPVINACNDLFLPLLPRSGYSVILAGFASMTIATFLGFVFFELVEKWFLPQRL